MNAVREAEKHVRKAHRLARDLLSETAARGDAESARAMNEIAETLALAEQGLRDGRRVQRTRKQPSRTAAAKTRTATAGKARVATRPKNAQYPRLVRRGDQLVRVTWSRSTAEEKEASAPKSLLLAVAAFLAGEAKIGREPSFDDMVRAVGTEPHTPRTKTQIRVCLDWLKQWRLVTQRRAGGYALRRQRRMEEDLKNAWSQTFRRR